MIAYNSLSSNHEFWSSLPFSVRISTACDISWIQAALIPTFEVCWSRLKLENMEVKNTEKKASHGYLADLMASEFDSHPDFRTLKLLVLEYIYSDPIVNICS